MGADDIGKDVTIYLWGDASGDGVINIADAMLILRYTNEQITLEDRFVQCSDVNGDGVTNIGDAMLILRLANGMISSFPVE